MNIRVGKSFGLALIAAVGVLALLLATGTFNPQKAGAQAAVISAVGVQPTGPAGGETTHVRVNFTSSVAIVEGQPIAITLEAFDVPGDIPTSEVSIRSSDKVGNPASVSVSGSTITLELGKDSDGVGMELTAATAASVTFTKKAGIAAPVTAGTYDVTVAAGGGTETDDDAFTIARTVTVSPASGDSGTEITVTGTSFTDGTANIYVNTTETSGNTEPDTAKAGSVTVSNGKFTTTISIEVGTGTDQFQNGNNYIHVFDASGIASTNGGTFVLNGTVTAPTELVKGTKRVSVKLEDAAASEEVDEVKIGGVGVEFGASDTEDDTPLTLEGEGTPTTDADGDVDILINVPGTVGTGSKVLALYDSSDDVLGSTMVEITALTLTLTPDTAVPGEEITLDGAGFDGTGDDAKLKEDGLTVGGVPVAVSGQQGTPTTAGRFFIDFNVPEVGDGAQTVRLEQAGGKIGEATLTIRTPAITIDPPSSRIGTPVTVTGTGFPVNDVIFIDYGKITSVGSTRSNSSGGWSTIIQVPTSATIGGTAEIKAYRPKGSTTVSGNEVEKAEVAAEVVEHTVPDAEVTLSATEASSGEMITITGVGFEPYKGVMVEFGSSGSSSTGKNTDANGDFTVSVQVPLLPPGSHQLVKVDVAEKIISRVLNIRAADAPTVPTPVTEVFAAEIASGNLIVAWRYDNDTETWSYFDPNLDEADNTYTIAAAGDIVWLNLQAATTFQGKSLKGGWQLVTLQ